jgi:hypothetical protein
MLLCGTVVIGYGGDPWVVGWSDIHSEALSRYTQTTTNPKLVTDTNMWHVNWWVNQSIKYQINDWILLNVYPIDNLTNFTVNSFNDRMWNFKISIKEVFYYNA